MTWHPAAQQRGACNSEGCGAKKIPALAVNQPAHFGDPVSFILADPSLVLQCSAPR